MRITSLVLPGILALAGQVAWAGTVINFDDLGSRANFIQLGIQNTYQGYSWSSSHLDPEDGVETGWATAITTDRVSQESITPVSGRSYAWNWNGPQSLFIVFGLPQT